MRIGQWLLVLVPVLALIFLVGLGISRLTAEPEPPAQPVAFPHPVHVQVAGLDCTFCHRNVTKGAAATIPSVEQCMFCHKVVRTDSPEVKKVIQAWENKETINWARVHRIPDHTNFLHEPHLRAGFQCSNCHGQVETMQQVRQVRTLSMGDCVQCHRQNNAPTECTVCHK